MSCGAWVLTRLGAAGGDGTERVRRSVSGSVFLSVAPWRNAGAEVVVSTSAAHGCSASATSGVAAAQIQRDVRAGPAATSPGRRDGSKRGHAEQSTMAGSDGHRPRARPLSQSRRPSANGWRTPARIKALRTAVHATRARTCALLCARRACAGVTWHEQPPMREALEREKRSWAKDFCRTPARRPSFAAPTDDAKLRRRMKQAGISANASPVRMKQPMMRHYRTSPRRRAVVHTVHLRLLAAGARQHRHTSSEVAMPSFRNEH